MKPALRNVKKAMTTITWKNAGVGAVCVVSSLILLPIWLWMAGYFIFAALLLPIYMLAALLVVAIVTAPWWGLSLIASWIAQLIRHRGRKAR